MKNIKKLTVTQIRIFPHDYLPYAHLLSSDFVEYMNQKYKFRRHEMPFEYFQKETPNILQFYGGKYLPEKQNVAINRLHFDDRRIVLETMSSSDVARKLFLVIARDIKKFDPNKAFKASNASYEAEETSCIANLSIEYLKVFSKEFMGFINRQFATKLTHKSFNIRPKQLSFEVEFEPDKDLFEKHKITLSPKILTLEPRTGEPDMNRVFYSESPFNSDTHFKLLEEFEKTFSS